MSARRSSKLSKFFRAIYQDGPKTAVWRTRVFIAHRLLADVISPEVERLEQQISTLQQQITLAHRQLRRGNDSIRLLTEFAALGIAAGSAKSDPPGPKISVIMPVYNRAPMLAASIRSVLAQEGADFELIIADDGSTDGLGPASVPDLEAPRVRLLKLPHAGASAARNRALAAATGGIIAYLDSDNLMYPGYLRALAAAYRNSPGARCGQAALLWDDGDASLLLRHDPFAWGDLLTQKINMDLNGFSHRAAMVSSLGGFDETLVKHADFDLVLRYTAALPPLHVPAIAAHYDAGDAFPRLSNVEASGPCIARILAKHRQTSPADLRILVYCSDYPQLSESYVDTEIAFMAAQGCVVEVFQRIAPGAPGVAQVPVHTTDLAGVIANFRPDIIHCHWLPMAAEVAALAAAQNIPVTVRGHGFEFSPESLANCAALAAVKSIYLFPHFAGGGQDGGGKIKPVRSCFNKARFYPRVGPDRRLVLRAAACLDSKDIEAFIRVAARCPNHRFVLALARIASLPDLPAQFAALNAALGNPVEISMDVDYEAIAALTGQAGIYLHTFGFKQPFGMPVSIAEAMACGAALLIRDCPAARGYAGAHAFYYNTEDEAAACINATLHWPEQAWTARRKATADFAYETYADDVVLRPILDDWQRIIADYKPAPIAAWSPP